MMALTCRSPGRRRVQPSSPHLFRPRAARAQRWRQLSRSSLSPGCLAGLECRGDSPAPGPGPAWTAALGLNQARTRLRAGLTLLDPAGASSGCPHLPNTPAQGGRRSGLRTPLPLLQSHHLLGIMPLPRALVGKARLRTLRLQAGHSAAGGPLRSPQWAPRLGKPVCGTPPRPHRGHRPPRLSLVPPPPGPASGSGLGTTSREDRCCRQPHGAASRVW